MKHRIVEILTQFVDKHPFASAVIVLAYILAPIDVFPEALAGLAGYLDDVLIVVGTLLLRRLGQRQKKS